MPDAQAARLYGEILSLNSEQQIYILNRLLQYTLRTISTESRLNITGLRGLGKEIWQGIDAQAYVDQERDSWN